MKAKSTTKTVSELLEFIRNKGNCFLTIDRAWQAVHELRDQIDRNDYWRLHIAMAHKEIGEGSDELNSVLTDLIPKYEKS